MAEIRVTKLIAFLLAMAVMAASCGGDQSDDIAKQLVAANEEITELENRVEELLDWEFELREKLVEQNQKEIEEMAAAHDTFAESNSGLESKITELGALLEEKDALLELFDDEDGLLELLNEKDAKIDELEDALDVPLHSSGPCGVFRLSGTELLKLRWIDDHRDDIDPREWARTEGGVWWEKTGVDITHEGVGYDVERRDLPAWLQRDPDHVMAVKVREGRNHYFHFEWMVVGPDGYPGSKVGPVHAIISDMEGLLGASRYMSAGVLGVDENCEWSMVIKAANSFLVTERRGSSNSDRWWVEFGEKDYGCDGVPRPWAITRYDAEADRFVTQCPEPD